MKPQGETGVPRIGSPSSRWIAPEVSGVELADSQLVPMEPEHKGAVGVRLASHDSGEPHQEDQRADGHGQPDNLIGVEWLSEDDRTDGRE